MGPVTFEILSNLIAPDCPTKKSMDELMKVLSDHFSPKINVIAERYKFYSRNQKLGESTNEYIVELKHLASSCNFKTFLEEALRDKLVSGTSSESLRAKLLSEKDLTWSKASQMALNEELTQQNLREMQKPLAHHEVKQVNRSRLADTEGKAELKRITNRQESHQYAPCARCSRRHAQGQCKMVNLTCFNCNRKGHIASQCRVKRTSGKRPVSYIGMINLVNQNLMVQISVEKIKVCRMGSGHRSGGYCREPRYV